MRFKDFRQGKDCSFEMIDSEMMILFENYLKKRDLKRNTISFYMRNLRSCYNMAVDLGLTSDQRPFKFVFTGSEKTVKRALSLSQVRKLVRLDLSDNPKLLFARDMFMFSVFARGMSFVDMAFLRKKDICDKHFSYNRRKTNQMITVEWLPDMQRIINRYPQNGTKYLLPIITRTDSCERRQYLTKLSYVNDSLKEIAALAGIKARLSMYWARHTWSTMARDNNVPIPVISQALGHNSILTTQIYLDSIETAVIDRANKAVLRQIFRE